MTQGSGTAGSDELIRDVLSTLAGQVPIAPDAYHSVRAEWVRRQRRRKRLGVLVATLLVALADVAGLWALNRSETDGAMIFDDRPPAQRRVPGGPPVGQP